MALLAFMGALVCAVPAVADPGLTLAQAQRLAVARSRQLPAKDAGADAARAQAVAAGQLPDPVLKFGVDNLPVNGADRFSLSGDFMTMRRVGVMQEWTRAEKRQLRSERFLREADKTRAEKDVAVAQIQRDTALAWLDRFYLEQMVAAISEQAAAARLDIQAAESAYRAGHGSQVELLTARSALAAIGDRASEFARRIQNARTMLARWTDTADLSLEGSPRIDTIRLDPATLESQLSHHPQIAVLSRLQDIAETEANLARANRRADWSVEVAFQQRGSAYSNMISVGVSIPLQWDRPHRQDQELSAKLALVEQATAERDDMLRAHVAETRILIAEWQNGRERLSRYTHELLPLADQRIDAAIGAYRGGKAALPDVLAARRNAIDVRLQALQLQLDTARLWAQLNFLFPDDGAMTHAAASTPEVSP